MLSVINLDTHLFSTHLFNIAQKQTWHKTFPLNREWYLYIHWVLRHVNGIKFSLYTQSQCTPKICHCMYDQAM